MSVRKFLVPIFFFFPLTIPLMLRIQSQNISSSARNVSDVRARVRERERAKARRFSGRVFWRGETRLLQLHVWSGSANGRAAVSMNEKEERETFFGETSLNYFLSLPLSFSPLIFLPYVLLCPIFFSLSLKSEEMAMDHLLLSLLPSRC